MSSTNYCKLVFKIRVNLNLKNLKIKFLENKLKMTQKDKPTDTPLSILEKEIESFKKEVEIF